MPVGVQGDGNCLFHAVSRALIGYETLYAVLRQEVAKELADNRGWYVEHVFQGVAEVFDEELRGADVQGTHAPVTHLVALANMIRRPVALLSSLEDMRLHADAVGSAVYLPARRQPAECCPHPLLIAWSSGIHNHYVPLCRTSTGPRAPMLPPSCRPPPGACVPYGRPEFNVENYIPVGGWTLMGTAEAQLPAKALAKGNEYSVFQGKLVSQTAAAARAALLALPPVEAAIAVMADATNEAAARGMLAVSVCVELEAYRQYHKCTQDATAPPDPLLDVIGEPAFAWLLAALPPAPAAALRARVAVGVRDQLYALDLMRQLDDDILVLIAAGLQLQKLRRMADVAVVDAENELNDAVMEWHAANTPEALAGRATEEARAAHAQRLERMASVNTRALLQRLAAEAASTPLPRWAPRAAPLAGCAPSAPVCAVFLPVHARALTSACARSAVSADSALAPASDPGPAPLRAFASWPDRGAALGKARSADDALAGAKLNPPPSAPAAVSLKRGRSSAEQFRADIEALRNKRLHVMKLQGLTADANAPLEGLFDQAHPDSDSDAEAGACGPLVLRGPTADDDDEDSQNLHAALMMSLMSDDSDTHTEKRA